MCDDIAMIYDLTIDKVPYEIILIKKFNLVEWIRSICVNNHNFNLKKFEHSDKIFTFFCQAIACNIFQKINKTNDENIYFKKFIDEKDKHFSQRGRKWKLCQCQNCKLFFNHDMISTFKNNRKCLFWTKNKKIFIYKASVYKSVRKLI